jgi:hypothetical protein
MTHKNSAIKTGVPTWYDRDLKAAQAVFVYCHSLINSSSISGDGNYCIDINGVRDLE